MLAAHKRYLTIETIVSMIINTAISIAFFYLVFGKMDDVATIELVPDAIPQTFMIALMSTIVPTLLTRKRTAAGTLPYDDRQRKRSGPRSLWLRAPLIAIPTAAIGVGITMFAVSRLFPAYLDFHHALLIKALYGAAVAFVITQISVRAALTDKVNPSQTI